MSGSHRSGDDRADSYRGPGGGRSDGYRTDGGGHGMGGSGERAARPGTGGYPEDPLGSPAGSPTSGYPTAPATGSATGRYSSGGYSTGGHSSGGHSSGGYATGGYSSGGYSTGGYSTGGYATGGYSTGGYSQSGGSGQYPSGGQASGGYGQGGGYGRDSGSGGYPTGGYPQSGGYSQSGGSDRYLSGGQASGGYGQGGGYGRDSGSGGYPTGGYPRTGGASGHEADSGRYAAGPPSSDDHAYARGSRAARTQGPRDTREPRDPRDTRDPRDSSGRGGYRSGTGSHRVVREERRGRRWGIVLVGAFAGIAACVLAVFVVVSGTGSDGTDGTGRIVGSGASESASAGTSEFSGVPDSCTIVGTDLIDRLAPDAERNEADNYQGNDRQTQCVWGVYAGDQKRQLTIELRAIEAAGGATATATAQRTYASEQKVDEAGEALLEGQELADKRRLDGVGDEGYVVYSVDGQHDSGEAIANVRHANVLVTIHYTGSDGEDPLSYETAGDGAVEAAEAVLAKLKES